MGPCGSAPENFNLDIFTNYIVLHLSLWNEVDIKAYVKWLKEYHLEACYIDTIKLLYLRLIMALLHKDLKNKYIKVRRIIAGIFHRP